jgi:hypothetical protein
MKRNLLLTLGISVLLFATLACSVSIPRNVTIGATRGSGNVVEQTYNVSGFDRVTLAGSGNLFIVVGDTEGLTVQAEDNLIPLLDVQVTGDELTIGFKSGTNVNPTRPMNFYVTVTNLSSVRLLGSGNVQVGPLNTNDLDAQIAGSGDMTLDQLTANRFTVEIPGSGRVQVNGTVTDQTITILGSGNYDAANLKSTNAVISIAGSADVTVDVSDSLSVNIAGNGTVRYTGNPEVKKTILGSGDIKKID